MYTSKQGNTAETNLQLFGNVRVMIISALFVAMSIVLGKYLQIPIGIFIRISFENLSVIMAGIFFGPFVGAAVGLCSDLIGCIMKGYTINPVITLGAACIGFVSGYVYMLMTRKESSGIKAGLPVVLSVFSAHITGSMIIKTVGIIIYYHTPFEEYIWRIPTYIIIAILETMIIGMLLSNKAFTRQLEKVCSNGRL